MEQSKKGKTMYVMCRIFLYCFMLLLIAKILIGTIDLVKTCVAKENEIEVTDTGYAYQFDGSIGYYQFQYRDRGIGGDIENKKAFCTVFILLSIMTFHVPYLMLMYFIRKILKQAESDYSPFVGQMVKDTNIVGGLLIGIGLCSNSIFVFGMAIASGYINVNVTDEIQYEWIFAGIMVLLFRDVFARGCVLQQDVDETL